MSNVSVCPKCGSPMGHGATQCRSCYEKMRDMPARAKTIRLGNYIAATADGLYLNVEAGSVRVNGELLEWAQMWSEALRVP